MKVMRIGARGAERPALLADDSDRPVDFLKAAYTVTGPNDSVLIPRGSAKSGEVELAVVIGRTARYLDSPAQALDHVAGCAITNDVSEREFQLERSHQWDLGRSCETFNQLGAYLVTSDEIRDPDNLGLPGNPDLRPGDLVESELTGLGTQTQTFAEA
jgi:2-keto-4-pentenoate hydratase/2-oxohepta-3-ene-1,7-dioic acid hydratase in catechol pathway